MVADGDTGHALAERLHDPRAFVAEHDRRTAGAKCAVGEVNVGVTDAGRGDADEHLARAGGSERDPLDRDRAPRLTQHAGIHLEHRLGHGGGLWSGDLHAGALFHTGHQLSSSELATDRVHQDQSRPARVPAAR